MHGLSAEISLFPRTFRLALFLTSILEHQSSLCFLATQSIKKWGKKGRKLRNKDPYGCHSDPDSVLLSASEGSSGAIVNAGKYTSSYTRANYAGAKAAIPFEGRDDRPKKGIR